MNKKETAQVLAILRSVYPTVKIENPEAMLKGWEWQLGDLPAELVMKAADIHAKSSKYFPTPAEIRKLIPRVQIIIEAEKNDKLLTSSDTKKLESGSHEKESDDWLEEFCKFVGLGYETDLDI